MKYNSSCFYIIMAICLMGALPVATAQNKEAAIEKQNQEQAELFKQQQVEEMKARKEMLELQKQKQMEMERQYADQARDLERQARESVRSAGVAVSGDYAPYFIGQENQSQLTLRKSFKETTNTSRGQFDVEPGVRHFRCMISGSVKSGEIMIGIEYPDGKVFKELTINSSADINFSQSISIKEADLKKYTGTWNYMIKAEKAEGNYMVQIMTN